MFEKWLDNFLSQLVGIGVDFTKASLRILLIIIAAYVGLRLLRLGLNRACSGPLPPASSGSWLY